jgi:mannosyltransferase OCH1-like enzyme
MKTFGIYMKVPLNIFQCGIDKKMISLDLIENNKEFNYFFFDENDCEKFILHNYPDDVYKAYKLLIPFDYKIDLWKYCVLYKYGGIYIHHKFKDNIKMINLIDNNFFVNYKNYYYNKLLINTDFIITKINNPIFMIAINEIIKNVNNKYYGIDVTYPTGAGLLGKIFKENNYKAYLNYDGKNISFKKTIIMKTKDNYQDDNYTVSLWITKNIYISNNYAKN